MGLLLFSFVFLKAPYTDTASLMFHLTFIIGFHDNFCIAKSSLLTSMASGIMVILMTSKHQVQSVKLPVLSWNGVLQIWPFSPLKSYLLTVSMRASLVVGWNRSVIWYSTLILNWSVVTISPCRISSLKDKQLWSLWDVYIPLPTKTRYLPVSWLLKTWWCVVQKIHNQLFFFLQIKASGGLLNGVSTYFSVPPSKTSESSKAFLPIILIITTMQIKEFHM